MTPTDKPKPKLLVNGTKHASLKRWANLPYTLPVLVSVGGLWGFVCQERNTVVGRFCQCSEHDTKLFTVFGLWAFCLCWVMTGRLWIVLSLAGIRRDLFQILLQPLLVELRKRVRNLRAANMSSLTFCAVIC
jgi:hypothetical protein